MQLAVILKINVFFRYYSPYVLVIIILKLSNFSTGPCINCCEYILLLTPTFTLKGHHHLNFMD